MKILENQKEDHVKYRDSQILSLDFKIENIYKELVETKNLLAVSEAETKYAKF